MRRIPRKEAQSFIDLYRLFLVYSSNRGFFGNKIIDKESVDDYPPLEIIRYKERIFKSKRKAKRAIKHFCKKNPYNLDDEKIELIYSMKNYIKNDFLIFRNTKEHTLFSDDNNIYAVKSLIDDLKKSIRKRLPVFMHTILFPYKDMIVYDGIIFELPISFSKEFKNALLDDVKKMEKEKGICYSFDDINRE